MVRRRTYRRKKRMCFTAAQLKAYCASRRRRTVRRKSVGRKSVSRKTIQRVRRGSSRSSRGLIPPPRPIMDDE